MTTAKTILLSLVTALTCMGCASQQSPELVIIHTNDTHSTIDPDPTSGLGGIARRKVLIDSIRAKHPQALLIDAGDAVQGTLYFHLFKGKVEQEMLNALGYDIQTLGNHEFDNGMEALKQNLLQASPTLLSSNYTFDDPSLAARFLPYVIRKINGTKIGFMALNLDPKGMVAEGNYNGVTYQPWLQAAQATADKLRQEGAKRVVCITHIGYDSGASPTLFGDRQVAAQTHGIDVIIGAHSHTLLNPAVKVANSQGDSVVIVQTGKGGQYLGEITLNPTSGKVAEKLIPVNARLDSRTDSTIEALLRPYRAAIDSLYVQNIATVSGSTELNKANPQFLNWVAQFYIHQGNQLATGVEGAIGNKGGLRTSWTPGPLSKGRVIDMMPFQNRLVVLDILGSDLLEALEIAAKRSEPLAGITTTPDKIDPQKTYRIATIDYLANGGDYMAPLTRAKRVATSGTIVYNDLLNYLNQNPIINVN